MSLLLSTSGSPLDTDRPDQSSHLAIKQINHPINVLLNAHNSITSPTVYPHLISFISKSLVSNQISTCLSVSGSPMLELNLVVLIPQHRTPTPASACNPRQPTSPFYHQLSALESESRSLSTLAPFSVIQPRSFPSLHPVSAPPLSLWFIVAQEHVPCLSISLTHPISHATELPLDELYLLTFFLPG